MRRERDVYIAIMVAVDKGTGVNLTWDECFALGLDDAICTRANNALTEDEWLHARDNGWAGIDPAKKREAANTATKS